MHLLSSLPRLRGACAASVWWLGAATSSAFAQTEVPMPACIDASEASHQTLLGHWTAQFSTPADQASTASAPTTAQLVLTPHPELSASVRGRLQRAGTEALLAGDVDQGDFTLEESINGTNISATWTGEVVDGSCGAEIRGTWRQEHPPLILSFVLRKQPQR